MLKYSYWPVLGTSLLRGIRNEGYTARWVPCQLPGLSVISELPSSRSIDEPPVGLVKGTGKSLKAAENREYAVRREGYYPSEPLSGSGFPGELITVRSLGRFSRALWRSHGKRSCRPERLPSRDLEATTWKSGAARKRPAVHLRARPSKIPLWPVLGDGHSGLGLRHRGIHPFSGAPCVRGCDSAVPALRARNRPFSTVQ